jgi:hypothetical protein
MKSGMCHVSALAGCLLVSACAMPAAAADSEAAVAPRHAALLAAPPGEWADRIAASLPMTQPEAAALLLAVRRQPTAAGAPAAVAALGRCAQPIDEAILAEMVADRGLLATEAAIALGERKAASAVENLRAAVADAAADATLRTAAACALVRMGHGRAMSPFLAAVLLAGTPAGVEAGARHGLPVRPRWAMERYLVQRLLLREGDPELARRLDPDASWPALEKVTAEVVAWLEAR